MVLTDTISQMIVEYIRKAIECMWVTHARQNGIRPREPTECRGIVLAYLVAFTYYTVFSLRSSRNLAVFYYNFSRIGNYVRRKLWINSVYSFLKRETLCQINDVCFIKNQGLGKLCSFGF
jgi:hypothetical protein